MTGADLLAGLLDDLAEQSRALDDAVVNLPGAGWGTATPAQGWTVAHQVAHLAWTDRAALRAVTGPEGALWTWGPPDAAQRVTGPALDFCLCVTQRRAREDLALSADGADADRWLDLAQAFAGPPGPGRAPLISPDRRGVLR